MNTLYKRVSTQAIKGSKLEDRIYQIEELNGKHKKLNISENSLLGKIFISSSKIFLSVLITFSLKKSLIN